jgi:hypothetical protein
MFSSFLPNKKMNYKITRVKNSLALILRKTVVAFLFKINSCSGKTITLCQIKFIILFNI